MTVVTRQSMTDDSGLFTDGSVVNKAFVDQLYDQQDDQCHSATNPTIKPKATTDEVVAARGSKASLDARLDVVLNEDGTLKTQASLVTAAQVQSALGGRNVAVNGDLDDWSGGGSAAPDSFTLTGAGATIARTGVAMGDTFQFGTGLAGFAAKITRAGTDWKLTQDVIASGVFTNFANVKGQKISVAVKGKTSIGSYLRIVIDDGVSTDASAYHTGGGTEEHLSVTHTISNSATKVSVYVEGTGSNGDAYVGGFNFVFADLAPSDWSPLSSTPDASATRRGLVGTGAQSFAGVKTFNSPPVGIPTFKAATADLTKNANVTPSDIAGLNFSVGANEVWAFQFHLKGVSAAAAGWRFTLTGPAAPTNVWFGVDNNQGNAIVGAAAAFGTAVLAVGSGFEMKLQMNGLLRNGANAGTVQAQMAQNVSDASNTIIRGTSGESYVLAWRIS